MIPVPQFDYSMAVFLGWARGSFNGQRLRSLGTRPWPGISPLGASAMDVAWSVHGDRFFAERISTRDFAVRGLFFVRWTIASV